MRAFGLTADGYAIEAATLTWPGGLQAEILTYGAALRRLGFPAAGGLRQAILSYDDLDGYVRGSAYVGAVVGRVANRIGDGRFRLDGREVPLSVNEPPNTLHGGKVGFDKRIWRVEAAASDGRSLVLAYTSEDGEEGFPGRLEVKAHFALEAADTLAITYTAEAAAPTAVNLSHHLYFNLIGDRSATVLDHVLQISADGFTPVGEGLIPTGAVAPVEGGPFDLRKGAAVSAILAHRNPQLDLGGGVDLNWALDPRAETALTLRAPDGATLAITTDQPGMQIYSGQKLSSPFVRYGGMAIEPQGFPDAVNHPDFPSQILRPGELYRRCNRYRLTG